MKKTNECVMLYDNDEAWIIKKHKTNHINKDCKYFIFDGFLIGCNHKLPDNIKLDGKKSTKYMFKSCHKNCEYKKPKNYITLKEAIELEVDKLKGEYKKVSYCASEIDRLEIKKTIMRRKGEITNANK